MNRAREFKRVEREMKGYAALAEIADDWFPRYGFSPYSVRLFATSYGVASVATPVRRALLSDSVELDLASSQLAIAAND